MLPLLFILLGVGALVMSKSGKGDAKTLAEKQAVRLPSGIGRFTQTVAQRQAEIATQGAEPYRLVDAVAMVNAAIAWAEFYARSPDTLYPEEILAVLVTGPRAALASILKAPLSEREKVRAVICMILLPLVCNEIRYEDTHDPFVRWGIANGPPGAIYLIKYKNRDREHEDQLARGRIRAFRKWLSQFYVLGTEIQQKQITYLTLWICMYFLGPDTGCVLKSTDLTREYTSVPWGLPIGPPVSIYRDDQWNLTPTVSQQQRAIVDIFQRVAGWEREFVLNIPKCEAFDPNPCMVQDGWARDIAGLLYDQTLRGLTPEIITGYTLKILQLIQRAQLETMLPEVYTPPSNPFFIIMGAIAAAIASVASLGAATAVIAPAVAAGIGVAMAVATTAAGIGQAIQNRASAGAVMQQVLGSSLAKSLVNDAALLLPADLAKAATTIQTAAKSLSPLVPLLPKI